MAGELLDASAAGFDAETVYRLKSYGAGVVYGALATAGYLQLFCGYVETYPPLFAGALF